MVPSWTKTVGDAKSNHYKFFNARDDKLTKSRLWKSRFQNKRCIILANGFFEPHHYPIEVSQPGGRGSSDSIPFYFTPDESDHFVFGGIYDEWPNPESGELVRSFSIITTAPNQQIKRIHNKKPRQPVILSPEDYGFWLDPETRPADYFDENIFAH